MKTKEFTRDYKEGQHIIPEFYLAEKLYWWIRSNLPLCLKIKFLYKSFKKINQTWGKKISKCMEDRI